MSKIGPFITGAAIGALAALVLAPQAGEQTRALVAEKANAVAGEAKDFSSGLPGSAQDILKNVTDKGASLVKDATSKGQDFVKEATGQPAEVDADDLRQKIEAARQRIAAQVMENAEQGKAVDIAAAAEDAVEDAAEVVADIAETAKHAAAEKIEEIAEA